MAACSRGWLGRGKGGGRDGRSEGSHHKLGKLDLHGLVDRWRHLSDACVKAFPPEQVVEHVDDMRYKRSEATVVLVAQLEPREEEHAQQERKRAQGCDAARRGEQG